MNRFKRKIKLVSKSLMLFVLTFVVFTSNISATSSIDVTDGSFVYWEGKNTKKPVETKAMYQVNRVLDTEDLGLNSIGSLEYSFVYNNKLYLLDGENGKILIFDGEYKLENSILDFNYNGEKVTFNGAKGLFVDETGIYIADTKGQRIICTNGTDVVSIIKKPESTAIPETMNFAPIRLLRDKNDFLYVLCDGSYYGLMVFSEKREFLGFFGANKVENSILDAVKEVITSIFETEEKHAASVQSLPFQMIDVCLDNKGFICTLTDDSLGQIRRFGPAGINTLSYISNYDTLNADGFNFGDYPNDYQDTSSKYGVWIKESFCSLTCSQQGLYYAVDQTKGRIFVYDNECNLLSSFGGGVGKGDKPGKFITAGSATVFGKDLVVTDRANVTLTIFNLTDYGETLIQASLFTNASLHTEAKPYWEEINSIDKNCQLAYKGLAKAYLQEKKYSKAMEYAKSGWDRLTYSKAFEKARDNYIKENFVIITIAALVIVAAITFAIIIKKKRNIQLIKNEKIRIAINTLFHPFESFNALKNRAQCSVGTAIVILAIFYLMKVVATLNGGFMYGIVDVDSFNSIFILLGTAGIVVLWSICNQGVSMLFEGKGNIKSIFCATCYSLTPMIIYYVIYFVLSYTIAPSVNSSIGILNSICTGLMIIYILISTTVIHEFGFFKSIGVGVVTIIGMLIVAFALFLMVTLLQDAVAFVIGIVNEITLR